MMRADALNSHVYPISTEMDGTQNITTSHVYSKGKSELKEFLVTKLYRRYILQMRTNQKASTTTNVLQRKTNKNAFTRISTNKKTQRMRQSMRNLQLQTNLQSILTYSNMVGII